jgi:hypothetical protein
VVSLQASQQLPGVGGVCAGRKSLQVDVEQRLGAAVVTVGREPRGGEQPEIGPPAGAACEREVARQRRSDGSSPSCS